MSKGKKKPCARGRYKSGPRKGHCKTAKGKKRGGCKCTSLPSCVAYVRKAYGVKRRFAAGKVKAHERRMAEWRSDDVY